MEKPLVDPKFWTVIAKNVLYMQMLTVMLYHKAPVNPVTGNKHSKIAMNVNLN